MVVVPALLAAMERHPNDTVVLQRCADAFFNLALHSDNRASLMDVVPALLAAMERHPNDAVVVHSCAGVFVVLAAHSDNCAALMELVPLLQSTLEQHARNPDVALKCVKFFDNLARCPGDKQPLRRALEYAKAHVSAGSEVGRVVNEALRHLG